MGRQFRASQRAKNYSMPRGMPNAVPVNPILRKMTQVVARNSLRWAMAALTAMASLLLASYFVDTRNYEERLDLVHATDIHQVVSELGPPIAVYHKLDQIHPSLAKDLFRIEDERAGLVLQRYNLWFFGLGYHAGYKTLLVKLRPSDGKILAARVQIE